MARIELSYQQMGFVLARLAQVAGQNEPARRSTEQWIELAADLGIITDTERTALDGLARMHALALLGEDTELTSERADEFETLTTAALGAIRARQLGAGG